jgi:hypothetical protein
MTMRGRTVWTAAAGGELDEGNARWPINAGCDMTLARRADDYRQA